MSNEIIKSKKTKRSGHISISFFNVIYAMYKYLFNTFSFLFSFSFFLTTDTPLGTATIPLTELMTTTKFYRDSKTRKTFSSFAMLRSFQKSGSNTNTTIPTTASNKTSSSTKYVTVRTDDRYVQVLTSNDGGRISKVASLRVVVILEDLGISSSNKSSSISTLETISNVAVTASARLSSSNATRQHPNARMENANAFGYATTNTSNRNLTQNTTNNNIQGTLNNMIFSSWRISIIVCTILVVIIITIIFCSSIPLLMYFL